ncbi:hypothetical protein PybrP1_002549 [[Pythium] brassicae (nom. inval.)]|nr:hypothetical protein PybrP1_002549 [[Pythium] brassicae (nom. inval.)]
MSFFRLRISNARQIVQVCSAGERMKAGAAQNEVTVLAHASLVVDRDGRVAAVGSAESVARWLDEQLQPVTFEADIDGRELCVLPGFVDAHTHPVWSGSRVGEFAMKLAGATYMQVHESGGGINRSVRATRASSEEELAQLLHARLDRMLRSGTTLIEAKSGYGLETDTELKMLRVLHNASTRHPVEIVANYLGGHSVPDGMTASAATDDIVHKQIPAVAQAIKDGTISPEFM